MKRGQATGKARGGRNFEKEVAKSVSGVVMGLVEHGHAELLRVMPIGEDDQARTPTYESWALRNGSKTMVFAMNKLQLPSAFRRRHLKASAVLAVREEWLRHRFKVQDYYNEQLDSLDDGGWLPELADLVDLGLDASGYDSGRDYVKKQYIGREIVWDGTILYLEEDELVRKVLLEMKSAKSTSGKSLDGNAQERFSYQNLEFLCLNHLDRYPKLDLLMLANGAFLKTPGKHLGGIFRHSIELGAVRAERYHMQFAYCLSQYVRQFRSWQAWLDPDSAGQDPPLSEEAALQAA